MKQMSVTTTRTWLSVGTQTELPGISCKKQRSACKRSTELKSCSLEFCMASEPRNAMWIGYFSHPWRQLQTLCCYERAGWNWSVDHRLQPANLWLTFVV